MDIDVEKIFDEDRKNNYSQSINPQEKETAENITEISLLKKVLIHLFFIIILASAGAFVMYSLSFGMLFFGAIFGGKISILIIALSIIVFFVIFYLYDRWRKKYDQNSILFRRW